MTVIGGNERGRENEIASLDYRWRLEVKRRRRGGKERRLSPRIGGSREWEERV